MSKINRIGVLGGKSLVGEPLIKKLLDLQYAVTALTRSEEVTELNENAVITKQHGLTWAKIEVLPEINSKNISEIAISDCISLAPIWGLVDQLPLLLSFGVRRIVVLSSTSKYTKTSSSNFGDKYLAERISRSESELKLWAKINNVEYIIIRPTLIYGFGRDKNISEIAGFIKRFHFFPVFGQASGMRQPIHASDVSSACINALMSSSLKNCSYNIAGLEVLTYREMVARVFLALGYKPKILPIPLFIFKASIVFINALLKDKNWSAAMAERMNTDMIFDTSDAVRDLDFSPVPFELVIKSTSSTRDTLLKK